MTGTLQALEGRPIDFDPLGDSVTCIPLLKALCIPEMMLPGVARLTVVGRAFYSHHTQLLYMDLVNSGLFGRIEVSLN